MSPSSHLKCVQIILILMTGEIKMCIHTIHLEGTLSVFFLLRA